MQVDLRALIGKLNHETRGAVEAAAGLCLSRTHYDVEIEHFLLKLLDSSDNDVALILKHFGVDRSRVAEQLTASLDSLKSGNAKTPSLSPSLVRMLRDGWTVGSVDMGAGQVRTGHAVLVLTSVDELRRMLLDASPELDKVDGSELRKSFQEIVEGSTERERAVASGPSGPGKVPDGRKGDGKTPHLDQYTVNLTQRAEEGDMDPVLAREFEVRQVVDMLSRRRQNNPILVGEAAWARPPSSRDSPCASPRATCRTAPQRSAPLARPGLAPGRGRRQGRVREPPEGADPGGEVVPTPIVLFIDEAHTMIGAGGQAGQGDAANLLKPALARGELRTVAATTWSEYKKYFEKDPPSSGASRW
jgi:type VI secretion system protein VasG